MRTVIYHANCDDGFGAAWAARRGFGETDVVFIPAKYGGAPPEVEGHDVFIADFSYPREVLWEMFNKAASIVVLDHHKTAEANLQDLSFCTFDMNRSGARMAWDHLFPGGTPPKLIQYIEDRDLWRFALPDSKAITAWIRSYPRDFESWDELSSRLDDIDEFNVAVQDGYAVLRSQRMQIERLCENARRGVIGGHDVPILCSPLYQSELGHELAKGEAFAAVWTFTSDGGRAWSLRSNDQGVDVSEIAKKCGGGGHARAAGFRTP